jgi:hypothetical protein
MPSDTLTNDSPDKSYWYVTYKRADSGTTVDGLFVADHALDIKLWLGPDYNLVYTLELEEKSYLYYLRMASYMIHVDLTAQEDTP